MRVGVIGSGASGCLAAMHLSRRRGCRVDLIGPSQTTGAGAAYRVNRPELVLNVRSDRMSLFPERPDHFVEWLGANAPETARPDAFAPRRLYRDYILDALAEAERQANGRLRRVDARVVRLRRSGWRWSAELSDGRRRGYDAVVLATGHAEPAPPPVKGLDALGDALVVDPWRDGWVDGVKPRSRVLLLGTGLTMVDAVLSLEAAGKDAVVLAVSRRGLLPRSHEGPRIPCHAGPPEKAPLSRRLQRFRRAAEDCSWRELMDEIRPHIPEIWAGFSLAERRRFLRHLRPWWDVHRHRTAPDVAARIEAIARTGRLRVMAARVLSAERDGSGAKIVLSPRGSRERLEAAVDLVVNCTGLPDDVGRDPLLAALIRDGTATADPLGLGVAVDRDGRVIAASGRPRRDLYALGPITRGTFWEIVAMPEIRVRAAALALSVVG